MLLNVLILLDFLSLLFCAETIGLIGISLRMVMKTLSLRLIFHGLLPLFRYVGLPLWIQALITVLRQLLVNFEVYAGLLPLVSSLQFWVASN